MGIELDGNEILLSHRHLLNPPCLIHIFVLDPKMQGKAWSVGVRPLKLDQFLILIEKCIWEENLSKISLFCANTLKCILIKM